MRAGNNAGQHKKKKKKPKLTGKLGVRLTPLCTGHLVAMTSWIPIIN
jgi:hypothetical protein